MDVENAIAKLRPHAEIAAQILELRVLEGLEANEVRRRLRCDRRKITWAMNYLRKELEVYRGDA